MVRAAEMAKWSDLSKKIDNGKVRPDGRVDRQ
jgi:hypothetical protein